MATFHCRWLWMGKRQPLANRYISNMFGPMSSFGVMQLTVDSDSNSKRV